MCWDAPSNRDPKATTLLYSRNTFNHSRIYKLILTAYNLLAHECFSFEQFHTEIKTRKHYHQAQNNIYFSLNIQLVIRVQQGRVG